MMNINNNKGWWHTQDRNIVS